MARDHLAGALADPAVFREVTVRELSDLFHRLNNQLGIILANGELLEARAPDDLARARAAQVVTSAIDALGTTRELRTRVEQLVDSAPSAGR